MKLLYAVILGVAFAAAQNPGLGRVKSVYLLPMSNGLDQYLANHIQADKVFTVVTNPVNADAVLTDSVGPAFERKFDELYPAAKEEEDVESKESSATGQPTFRRGRGVVFLVDRTSRQVIWSAFRLPKDTSAKSLNRVAEHMSEDLKKAVAGK